MKYISKWTEHFEIFESFSWIILKQFPDWSYVKKSMQIVGEKGAFDMAANSSAVSEQFGYVKSYCSTGKLAEWRSNNVPPDKRWTEIFKHMEAQNVPFDEFATVIEFILCFPGTSAPVERDFFKFLKTIAENLDSRQVCIQTSLSMLVRCQCSSLTRTQFEERCNFDYFSC